MIKKIIKTFNTYKNIKIIKTENLPLGMNVMGFKKSYLEKCVNQNQKVLETGWGRIFNEHDVFKIECKKYSKKDIRLTLDYSEDELFLNEVIRQCDNVYKISDKELINIILVNRLYKLNNFLNKKYMQNFNSELQNEN